MSNMKPTHDPSIDPDQLVDVRAAAGILGVSVRTVWRYIDAETLPSVTLTVPRGARRVRLSDVHNLTGTVGTTPTAVGADL